MMKSKHLIIYSLLIALPFGLKAQGNKKYKATDSTEVIYTDEELALKLPAGFKPLMDQLLRDWHHTMGKQYHLTIKEMPAIV